MKSIHNNNKKYFITNSIAGLDPSCVPEDEV